MKKVIRIRNLDCAACAAELSEELEALEGVESAAADFINQRVSLEYINEKALERCIHTISHFEEVEIIDENAPVKRDLHLKEILSIALSAVLFVPALVLGILKIEPWSLILYVLSCAAAGWAVAWNIVRNIVSAVKARFRGKGLFLFDENFLMTVAAVGAFVLGQNMEGALVMLLYEIGELLQQIAVGSSRSAITRLMSLKSDSALLVKDGETKEVPPDTLEVGDCILLRKGDKVPVDCKLAEGETSLDTRSLTGEAYLKEVSAGDELLAGCVNAGNAVKATVIRPSSESAVSKILELVENSSAKKAKPEKFITRFARIYTPVVVLIAVIVGVLPPLVAAEPFGKWIVRALNFLVISCPCALIISVPLTYFSGVGTLARCGVLAKGAVGLDALARVKVAAFDKTGTLTEGKFSISSAVGGERVLLIAAAAEKSSSHPLAQAFETIASPHAEECEEIAGMGLSAVVEGKRVLVGSLRLMKEKGVAAEPVSTSELVVYVAEEGKLLGYVLIADRVRPEAKEALAGLKKAGLGHIAVLTGDTVERASEALKALPVDEIAAGLLPEEKPRRAEELRKIGALLYVGDGINDTPVMAESDVAVAMGGLGSDAAIEASDFVLAGDDLRALGKAVRGAKKTKKIVFENIVGSIAIKVALMVLSFFGQIPLWAAVLGDVGVMLLAVLNSMRMRARIK